MRLWAISTVALLLIGGMLLAQDVVLLGGETQVNDYTLGPQRQSAVAADAEGDFVVVWQSTYSDGNDTSNSIQAQRYASRPVLVDSCESGDLSAWSSIVQ